MARIDAVGTPTSSSGTRILCLSILALHHMTAWIRLAGIKDQSLVNQQLARKLAVFKDFGPRFLTNWNFFNQTVYIFAALYIALAPRLLKNQGKLVAKLRKISSFYFWTLVFPWTVFIPSLFWSVYAYDRELIFPSYIDYVFPHWLNHSIHTVILVLALVEMLTNDERPPQFSKALPTLTVHALVYACVLNYTYLHNGVWLYEFLNLLNWPLRIAMYGATYVGVVVALWAGLQYQERRHRFLIKTK